MTSHSIEVSASKDVVVITGGTGGIGHYLCEGYHQLGYLVYALDVAYLKPLSEGIVFKQVDLGEPEAVQAVFEEIYRASGPIHILINNGAIANFTTPLELLNIETLDRVLNVNLRGVFVTCKAMIEKNEGASYGRIINIASTRALQNEGNWDVYGLQRGAFWPLVILWQYP